MDGTFLAPVPAGAVAEFSVELADGDVVDFGLGVPVDAASDVPVGTIRVTDPDGNAYDFPVTDRIAAFHASLPVGGS